jgi:hypothetical protein
MPELTIWRLRDFDDDRGPFSDCTQAEVMAAIANGDAVAEYVSIEEPEVPDALRP